MLAAGLLLGRPAQAQFESTPMAVVRPGAGMLVADGLSKVPLQIVLMSKDRGPSIRTARIVASEGTIEDTKVVGPHQVQFTYAPPKRGKGLDEIFDVALTMTDGNTVAEAFTLVVPGPKAPTIEVSADPTQMSASSAGPVRVQATAFGEGLEGLIWASDAGPVAGQAPSGDAATLVAHGTFTPPQVPQDAPSHFVLVAVAASGQGYAAVTTDIPVSAEVRLSVEIPPGTSLEVQGANNQPDRVPAPADGRTVMENVEVDLTSPLKIFERRGKKRRQLSVVVPTGIVSNGVAVPIPGQTLADGGVGPTIIVALPPPAFGAPVFWPDITVEGAQLVRAEPLNDRMQVLILARPREPKGVRVLLDEQSVGTIEFSAARGQRLRLESLAANKDERAAASVVVTDAEGIATDFPAPRVRLASGVQLPVDRVAAGRYRVHVPAGTQGAPDTKVELIAELDPLPRVAGASIEYAQASLQTTLSGPPPAVKAKPDTPVVQTPVPERRRGPSVKIGVGVSGLVAGTFDSLLMFGGGLGVDVRLPVLDFRLSLRTGVEFMRGSAGGGRVSFDEDRRLETSASIGGFLFPLEVGFAVVSTDSFELLLHAGGALRAEQAALHIQDNNPGGASRVGFGARAGAEAALTVGKGALYLGIVADGLGASLSGFSTEQVTLSGSLFNLRGDLGYRIWF